MTKTIASQSSTKRYFLTISETIDLATDCSCGDRHFRHHTCKHMSNFNREVNRAATFNALVSRFDIRSQAVRDAKRTAYINFEMTLEGLY